MCDDDTPRGGGQRGGSRGWGYRRVMGREGAKGHGGRYAVDTRGSIRRRERPLLTSGKRVAFVRPRPVLPPSFSSGGPDLSQIGPDFVCPVSPPACEDYPWRVAGQGWTTRRGHFNERGRAP